jgi:hypothetical protein
MSLFVSLLRLFVFKTFLVLVDFFLGSLDSLRILLESSIDHLELSSLFFIGRGGGAFPGHNHLPSLLFAGLGGFSVQLVDLSRSGDGIVALSLHETRHLSLRLL